MSRILPEELYTAQLDNVLHYQNSQRNVEANWHGLWNETFFSVRNPTTHNVKGLTLHPQYTLVQWGVIRAQSPRLELLLDSPKAPNQKTSSLSKQEGKRLKTSKGDLVPGDQKRLAGRQGVLLAPNSIAQRLLAAQKATSDPPHSASVPKPSPHRQPTLLGSLPSNTPTEGDRSSESPPCIVDETLRAVQGYDSYFTVDFALYRICGSVPESQTYQIFGHIARRRNVHIPIIVELKAVPSRSRYGADSNELLRHSVSSELRKAYEDCHLKVPVVFQAHPQQQSIIALAATGYWWSFSLLRKADTQAEWSKAFTCGIEQHDLALRKLYAAAEDYPDDPEKYDDGWIRRCLQDQRRSEYSEVDCMASNTPFFRNVD